MDRFEEQLANLTRVERELRRRGIESWGWTDELRQAFLRGEIPDELPRAGEPVVKIENARPISPYMEFHVLRERVYQAQQGARRGPEAAARAEEQMAAVMAEAVPLVSKLGLLARKASHAYAVVAECRKAQIHAGTPLVDMDGQVHPNVSVPPDLAGKEPKAEITVPDLVALALDPDADPFQWEHRVPAGAHTNQPEEPPLLSRPIEGRLLPNGRVVPDRARVQPAPPRRDMLWR